MVKVFVPKEDRPGETRVAATPESVKKMVAAGFEVAVEAGAGHGSHIADGRYESAGATLATDRASALASADAVLRVIAPGAQEAASLKEGAILVGLLSPAQNLDLVRQLAGGKVSSLAMELVPRLTRAQTMDALSSRPRSPATRRCCWPPSGWASISRC